MGRKWVRTKDQDRFLVQKLALFAEARSRNRQSSFFIDLYKDWFAKWPENALVFKGTVVDLTQLTDEQNNALGEAVFLRKEQLKNYIYWHSDKDRNARRKQRFMTLAELLKRDKRKRQRHLIEVYSKLFYQSKIAPLVKAEIAASTPSGGESKKEFDARRMTILRRIRKETWADETPEVRRMVEEERARLQAEENEGKPKEPKGKGKKAVKTNEPNENGDEWADPEDDVDGDADDHDVGELKLLQDEIANLGPVLWEVVKELRERTGWSFTVLCGGLRVDGQLESANLHCGVTSSGLTFQEHTIDFQQKVLDPWITFLRSVYSSEKEAEQASWYKKVYGIENPQISRIVEPLGTALWKFEEDEDKEVDTMTVVPKLNEAIVTATMPLPGSDSIGTGLPGSTIANTTSNTSHPSPDDGPVVSLTTLAVPPPIPTSAVITPPVEAASVAPNIPLTPLSTPDNQSGLYLTNSVQNAEQQDWNTSLDTSFPSFTDEMNTGPGGLLYLAEAAEHASLLQQNTHNNVGLDDMGMDTNFWKWIEGMAPAVGQPSPHTAASTTNSQATTPPVGQPATSTTNSQRTLTPLSSSPAAATGTVSLSPPQPSTQIVPPGISSVLPSTAPAVMMSVETPLGVSTASDPQNTSVGASPLKAKKGGQKKSIKPRKKAVVNQENLPPASQDASTLSTSEGTASPGDSNPSPAAVAVATPTTSTQLSSSNPNGVPSPATSTLAIQPPTANASGSSIATPLQDADTNGRPTRKRKAKTHRDAVYQQEEEEREQKRVRMMLDRKAAKEKAGVKA